MKKSLHSCFKAWNSVYMCFNSCPDKSGFKLEFVNSFKDWLSLLGVYVQIGILIESFRGSMIFDLSDSN